MKHFFFCNGYNIKTLETFNKKNKKQNIYTHGSEKIITIFGNKTIKLQTNTMVKKIHVTISQSNISKTKTTLAQTF